MWIIQFQQFNFRDNFTFNNYRVQRFLYLRKHSSMQNNQPCSARFEVFTELPNGKGFKIKDSKYVYLFDKYGGWYDQHNNYYNHDGQPEDPPSDEDDDFERVILEDEVDDEYDDDYEKQYGGVKVHSDDEGEVQNPTLAVIAKNIAILNEYPLKTALRVDYSNMNFKVTKEQIIKFYKSKVKGILNVILLKENGKSTGQGYFVCDDVTAAEKLIKFEGQEFLGRKVYFDVEPFSEFLAEPVTKEEKNIIIEEDDFEPLVKQQQKIEEKKEEIKKKKFINKNSVAENKQVSNVEEVKEVKKQEEKPKFVQPTWAAYKADLNMFPKKDTFLNWMAQKGFKAEEHYKNIQKANPADPNNKQKTLQIRSDALEKIQDLTYENKKVHFEKFN